MTQETQSNIEIFLNGLMTIVIMSVGATMIIAGTLDVGLLIGSNILAARALQGTSKYAKAIEFLKPSLVRKMIRELPTKLIQISIISSRPLLCVFLALKYELSSSVSQLKFKSVLQILLVYSNSFLNSLLL